MSDESSQARWFVDVEMRWTSLNLESEREMDLTGGKKGERFGTEREVERKVMEVRGGGLKGKGIEMSQDGRDWARSC
jgi:hypothetical protein